MARSIARDSGHWASGFRHWAWTTIYSWRNAVSGSTLAARRAGTYDASPATAASSVSTTAYVVASFGVTPNSSVPNDGSTTSDNATPASRADADETKPVFHDRPCELSALRPERDAQADLARALADHEREQRIQTQRREQQPAQGKRSRYERGQPFLREAFSNRFLEHPDVSDCQIRDPCDGSRS